MEHNRVLWVIFSISLFLVVVLGVGLYLLRPVPGQGPEVAAQGPPRPGAFDAFEYVRGKTDLPGVAEPTAAEETLIVVGTEGQLPAAEAGAAPQPAAPPRPEAAPAPAGDAPAPAGVASRSVAPAPAASGPVTRPAPSRPAAAPRPRAVKVEEYWIQVASLGSLSGAEEAARSLVEQGLAPLVTTRELSGKTYYRVRVGPYPTKPEAEKFLDWVKNLKGYEGSYISMVSVRRPSP